MTAANASLAHLGEILASVARAVGQAIGNREGEFLALGASLQEFTRTVSRLTAQASEIAELTSGEEIDQGVGELTAELDHMRGIVARGSESQSLQELDAIIDVSRQLNALTQDFRRIIKKLQMLGISTRIESARLGSLGRGFTTLADDVDKLAQNIVTHSAQIIQKSLFLNDLVSSVRERTNAILAAQQECSTDIFICIEDNLHSLVDVARKSEQVSAGLPDKARDISREIGEIVSSLQFHDIVRQQVEHVVEALEEGLRLLAPYQAAERLDKDGEDVVGWLADVCALQASQVQNASETLSTAVERLRGHMRGIARHAAELGRSLAETVSAGSDGGNSLDRIEQSIARAMGSMREYAEQGEAVGAIMNNVASTISEMSSFVSDIEDVGAEIELIALNASVKAAHTGEEGKALGVLAQSIQHLSVEARNQTEAVSSVLMRIAQSSEALLQNADKHLDNSQVDVMIGRLGDLTNRLRRVRDQVDTGLAGIGSLVEGLAGDIGETVEGIAFHHDMARGLDEARERLTQAGQEARRIVPGGEDVRRSERLTAMLDRYTMDAERIIHMSALGHGDRHEDSLSGVNGSGSPAGRRRAGKGMTGARDAAEPLGQKSPARGEILGDNIELF